MSETEEEVQTGPVQVQNPMRFWCAPNQFTPDYSSYSDFRLWLAYSLMECWPSHDGDDPNADCNMERPITREDVRWLRSYFLDVVETVVEGLWSGDFEPGEGWLDIESQYLTISAIESEEHDRDETNFRWQCRLDDDAMMFELYITNNDNPAIWLNYDAIEDRPAVIKALEEARLTVGIGTVWDKLKELVDRPAVCRRLIERRIV